MVFWSIAAISQLEKRSCLSLLKFGIKVKTITQIVRTINGACRALVIVAVK